MRIGRVGGILASVIYEYDGNLIPRNEFERALDTELEILREKMMKRYYKKVIVHEES